MEFLFFKLFYFCQNIKEYLQINCYIFDNVSSLIIQEIFIIDF